ncbi:MAG TPA: PASTA domain-containing protein [Candidatus Hydrogenedens sp.]|nr:PASTA domain-containing protein [Candidatus Hydrogenedens sp.]
MKTSNNFHTLFQSNLLNGNAVLSFVFCFFLCGTIFGAVIQINSIEELQKVEHDAAYPLNGEYELTHNIDASGTKNWNAGEGFNPIGTFIGKFNGNGYKITGLYINCSGKNSIGLFSCIGSGGEVKNLGLENCWVTGKDYVGGLVGDNEGNIMNSYSTGNVSGGYYVGGLVGNNYFYSAITDSYSAVVVSGDTYVGGLVGNNNGSVINSYNTGDVYGNYSVGGLVGHNYYFSNIMSSYSIGVVSGNGKYIGGLVGHNSYGLITNNYSAGEVSGSEDVGGLVGWNGTEGIITNSFSTGAVAGDAYVGGLVGYIHDGGTVTSSYWNVQTSGQENSAGGEGKTTVEMMRQSTYVGWDFTTIWKIIEGQSYPYFSWQTAPLPSSSPVNQGIIYGQVLNSISKKPVWGAMVELGVGDSQGTVSTLTDANGEFVFSELGEIKPPCQLSITKRKYKSQTFELFSSGADLEVALEPEDIQKPNPPQVYIGPHSIRIAWGTNSEYNIAGYNVYRRVVGSDTWIRLNSPTSPPYQGYIDDFEYVDTTADASNSYEYAIQAVSDIGRYTELSEPSEVVESSKVTVFFPEEINYKNGGMYLERYNPASLEASWIRIPVSSRSVYDVSTNSIQIESELPPELLLGPSQIYVQLSGITAGMMMLPEASTEGNKIFMRITASGVEGGRLYGSGTLFNIIAKPNWSAPNAQCGLLHLIPSDGQGNGVVLLDNVLNQPITVGLVDGQLCTTGNCILGDVNNDGAVNDDDAKYVLDCWVKKKFSDSQNICLMKSGDINLDRLVDSADSSLIQRWLKGKPIAPTPPNQKLSKSYNKYVQDMIWLAETGSMAAETILADIEKSDTEIDVWISEHVIGSAGTEKTISIFASNVSNLSGYNLVLNFDKEYAEVKGVQLGSGASGLKLSSNVDINVSGNLRVSAAGEENIGEKSDAVELLKVLFKMVKDGDAELQFAEIRVNDKYAYVPMFDDPKAPKIQSTVPDVVGMTEVEARESISAAHLSVGALNYELIKTEPPDIVLSQTPTAGLLLKRGSTVDLTINKGVTVPNVVGMSEAKAKETITGAGLTIGSITSKYDDVVPKGNVISQKPVFGKRVNSGTSVNLTISKGEKRRLIISCGTNDTSQNSSLTDIIFIGLISGFLLITTQKAKRPFNNKKIKNN